MPKTDPAVAALQEAVRQPTVSYPDPDRFDATAFEGLHQVLRAHFPLLFAKLEVHRIGRYGLLAHWRGAAAERPVVLMAHQDVVPIDESAPWQYPPFSGEIHDGHIWGRGTLDDKGSLVAICAAVERLLQRGVTPAQDVWLSFGANEEVAGSDAPEAVAFLADRGVRPWFVLDEGGAIAADAFPGITAPLGVVGVAEKGTTTLELRATGRGGHASTPSRRGPTATIARAVWRLDRRPFPAKLPKATLELFRRIAPHLDGPLRPLLANASRLSPVLARALVRLGPETAAMAQTTMVVTTLSGSPGHNVIATTANAGVNLRLQVGDTVADAIAHVQKAIADPQIEIIPIDVNEPSAVSPVDSSAFGYLESLINSHFPEAIATPYVMMAGTDSRFFTGLTDGVYRFTPFFMSKLQREAIHSYDEHLGVTAYLKGVDWYADLIEGLS